MFWVPQSANIGLGVSILSFDGHLQFGVITDAALVPDPQAIIDRFRSEFETYARLTGMTGSVPAKVAAEPPFNAVATDDVPTEPPSKAQTIDGAPTETTAEPPGRAASQLAYVACIVSDSLTASHHRWGRLRRSAGRRGRLATGAGCARWRARYRAWRLALLKACSPSGLRPLGMVLTSVT